MNMMILTSGFCTISFWTAYNIASVRIIMHLIKLVIELNIYYHSLGTYYYASNQACH